MKIEPITRVEGHLGIETKIENGYYTFAKVKITMFRGFELLLKNKKLNLAPNIAGKICGVCGATHTLVSIEALEMASGIYPSSGVIDLRNVAYALADIMYNNVTVAFIFEGIDFSSPIVASFTPSQFEKALNTYSIYRDIHGYTKVSDIMDNLYYKGEIYKTALKISTKLRDLATLIWLRYPQPLSLKVGGIEIRDKDVITKIKQGLKEIEKDIEKLFYVTAELREFYKNIYKDLGANFITYGLLDSHDYNANYEDMNNWGIKRFIPPALIRKGELLSRNLIDILLGVRVYTEGTAYDNWEQTVSEDPLGNKVDLHHPWNKETKLKQLSGNYLFTVKQVFSSEEFMPTTGDIARLYSYRLQRGKPKAFNYEWDYIANDVVERLFARMFTVGLLYDYIMNLEESKEINQYKGKGTNLAVGAHDAPRGGNAHWILQKDGIISRYQIITPTDRNFSSNGGPVEESIIGQKVTEEVEKVSGLDALRIIRSFDPCSACAVHIITKDHILEKLL
ncbi:nickel-dependent hydrogenase large subunit [Sulfurisphaera javensis]|uniref:Nickel-dependent hydrogenase large subunit n=1 Tax=Sulfurisphaera javensis TaxID=2049879 RepID=A0AAT9GT37_9CREN